ncbi:zinc ribbon domain-containing protein [Actinomyces howellii]|uniref:Recombinase n=1 Tax=Actinomyces howellii TaxID=52771 RepID=A0A448HJQ6_9ACTO|nr:zinc ribbon domain-containing protein [Actinomyces howellii]VEG29964.1 Uncharacterised protein [Actinomyces howellii]
MNAWYESTVGSIHGSARISGQRAYEPASKTTATWERRDRAILGPGNRETIITPEETAHIRAVVNHPNRRVDRPSKSLLAGLITCAKCDNTLVSSGWHRGETCIGKRRFHRYLPLPASPEHGGLVVSAHGIETLVGEAMITRLAATTLPTTDPGEDAGVSAIDTLVVKPADPGKRGARFRPERVELTPW